MIVHSFEGSKRTQLPPNHDEAVTVFVVAAPLSFSDVLACSLPLRSSERRLSTSRGAFAFIKGQCPLVSWNLMRRKHPMTKIQ